MGRKSGGLAWALVLAPLALAAPATAQDFSAGKKVDRPEASRSLGDGAMPRKAARTGAPQRSGEAGRALPGASAAPSYRMIGRSRDGTAREIAPSQRVIEAIQGEKKAELSRDVIGRDGRSHVKDTTQYPNIAVGFLQSTNTDPQLVYNCTASLIGPRIAITAAQCVYDHDVDGGWLESSRFWPALNGADVVPFGEAEWDEMYVLEDYIKDYDGSYDSVWPYDVAVIVFKEPVGDNIGWLGYNSFEDLDAFDAVLTGYGDGREPWRQFDSKCKVPKDDITALDIMHQCDADSMSTGAPVYVHDAGDDSYTVLALNMGGLNGKNWALRITEPIALWIDDLNRR